MARRKFACHGEALAELNRRDAERLETARDGGPSELGEPHWWMDVDLLCALLQIGRTTLWRWVRAGTFPPPYRFGPRLIVWSRVEVGDWAEAGGQRPKLGRPIAR